VELFGTSSHLRLGQNLRGGGFEIGHEGHVGKHGHFDELDREASSVARRRGCERRNVQRHRDDAPERAWSRLFAALVERVELHDLASGRNHGARAFGEHLLMATVTNDSQSDHSGAWEAEAEGNGERSFGGGPHGVGVDQPKLPSATQSYASAEHETSVASKRHW
jgi:hypothetical protein